jgi:hypothetical protein
MKNDPIKNFRELIERSRRLMAQDAQRGLRGGDPNISAPFNVQHNAPEPPGPSQGNPVEQQYQFRRIDVAGRSPSEVLGSLPDAPNDNNDNAPSVQTNVLGTQPDTAPAPSKIQQAIAKINQSGIPTTPNPQRDEIGKLATDQNRVNVKETAQGWPPSISRGGRSAPTHR